MMDIDTLRILVRMAHYRELQTYRRTVLHNRRIMRVFAEFLPNFDGTGLANVTDGQLITSIVAARDVNSDVISDEDDVLLVLHLAEGSDNPAVREMVQGN